MRGPQHDEVVHDAGSVGGDDVELNVGAFQEMLDTIQRATLGCADQWCVAHPIDSINVHWWALVQQHGHCSSEQQSVSARARHFQRERERERERERDLLECHWPRTQGAAPSFQRNLAARRHQSCVRSQRCNECTEYASEVHRTRARVPWCQVVARDQERLYTVG